MKSRRIRRLTIALACMLVPASAGAQPDEGLRLKLERQLRMAPPRAERESAKFIEADRIVGEQDRNVVATGNVTLRQRGATIRADRVEYSVAEQIAVATGTVRLEREGDTATGPRLRYNLADDTGEMEAPVFELPKSGDRRIATRGKASRAALEPNQFSRLFDAEYTSCPAPRDDWVLRVRELEVDGGRNVGTARDTTVFFLGAPILYSPYLSFALDNKRKTGFLAPTFGSSGESGLEMALPYYWNIAENRDATITPKIYSRRGLQLGGEFRYLEPSYNGQLEGEYLPSDRVAHRDRYFAGVRHSHQLGRGWHAALQGQKVSDDDYFRDLSTKIAATSQTNLARDAIVAYGDDRWAFSARALAYQTLQDPLAPVPIPYRILPQLLASGLQQDFHGFDLQFAGELSNFRHPTLVNGQRFIAYPSIAWPLRRSYGYIVPRVGHHFTQYKLDANAGNFDDDASRSVPIASVDAGVFFDRPFRWMGRGFLQTLEPRLFYLYVPFRDQSRLPNFTTAESDFNFAQIFTDNRFVGGDRIGDANQLTLGLTTRLIESETGLERFKGALGQVYYFEPQRVTLEGGSERDRKSSDILALVSSQLSPRVSFDVGWQYTPNLTRSEKITVGGHYHPQPGSIVNAAYRYARNAAADRDIEQVDLSTQWPVTRNLSALARWNWSIEDRKLVEGLAGFEYNAGCWQLRAVAHRFITATQQYSTSFQIQLELTGLTRIGINPLETIRQNIFGYRRIDEIAP